MAVLSLAEHSFELVSRELAGTLDAARRALEDCVDGHSDREALLRAARLLHLAFGALTIVEIHGAALLAEEMEQTSLLLAQGDAGDRVEQGLEALTRALVQLPAYLERRFSGGRDIPLVLLPLLNDLRRVCGKSNVSESTLLVLNAGLYERHGKARPALVAGASASHGDLDRLAQRVRPMFQAALLAWIRGADTARSVDELLKASAVLERDSATAPVRQLWSVLAAVLIAVRSGGLEPSVALKRLIGQADRQLKRLSDGGENALVDEPPVDLINNLLLYVARSTVDHERIRAVRDAYDLTGLVPGEGELEQAREDLAGPSVKLMHTVAQAIKEDLSAVKDVLDIYARTGMNDAVPLGPQLEMLKKIGDTLGVLGLDNARGQIQDGTEALGQVVVAGKVADAAPLERVAATLLDVEDALDRELVRAVLPGDTGAAYDPDDDAQHRHITQAVMGECIVNLAKVKESVIKLVDRPGDARALDQAKAQLRGIGAGLLMLNKTTAMKVVERIGAVIATRLAPSGSTVEADDLERLADVIVSLEYYMETVGAGRGDPWHVLENAERCLDQLESLPAVRLVPTASRATPVPPPPVMQLRGERSQPEIVEIFIEEAKEEIANIDRWLPRWCEHLDDAESLVAVRRSFHTLKGSGRTVGAPLIGEFAWSVENLLNRLINQTLQAGPPMVQLIAEAARAVPQLIEQLESGVAPRADVHALMNRIEAFAAGDPGGESSAAGETTRAPALDSRAAEFEEPPAEDALGMDPVLADIFVKEMRGHLAVIRAYIEQADASRPAAVEEPLFRACHTLLGSARMAGFQPAMAIAGPLAEHMRRHFEGTSALMPSGVDALREAADEIERIAAALARGAAFTPNPDLPASLAMLADAQRVAAPVRQAVADTFDPQIAAIFAEEAAELLDNAQRALNALRASRNQAPLAELRRFLHTLKGGARMAGLSGMGDLSHALETLLDDMSAGRLKPEGTTIDAVQRCLDRLHDLREAIRDGHADYPAAVLAELEALHSSAAGAAPPDVGAAAVPLSAADTAAHEPPAVEGAAAADETVGGFASHETACAGFAPFDITTVGLRSSAEVAPAAPAPGEPTIADEAAADAPLDEQPAGRAAVESLEPPVSLTPHIAADTPPASELSRAAISPSARPEPPAPAPSALAAPAPNLPAAAPRAPAAVSSAPATDLRSAERAETARVDAALLDELLNGAGEINIFQSRLNQQLRSIDFHLGELGQTVSRLREQLRKLETETEAQILHRHQDDPSGGGDFDPLELDRYSTIQQLSRALAETANDVASINELLHGLTGETDTLLTQQARVTAELQDGLMQTRMVPFHRYVARLARIVRQACLDARKSAELEVEGENSELDRQVLESMLPPFEHLLRNCVVHGIEETSVRVRNGKRPTGRVRLMLKREGAEVLIEVDDDGAGLDFDAIRRKAYQQKLVDEQQAISDQQAIELILQPGFSTAGELTQAAGRGVGMDVVDSEVKKLGGSMRIESKAGEGTRFLIRLPYTLAITHALIVNVGEETFALPLPTVEGITRVPREKILRELTEDDPKLDYGGVVYRIQHLGSLVGAVPSRLPEDETAVSLVLVRAGDNSSALLTDSLEGSREIVVKTLGPHIASVPGVSGATILGDGRVIVILDAATLVRAQRVVELAPVARAAPRQITALVVDDSITMRRVTQRLLERRGVKVLTARDGLDAITVMQEHEIDVILLDIEMPRMDGYQLASHVRNDAKLEHLPMVMITSRSGEKHRAKAIEVGVNDYLSKPYRESQLVAAIEALLGKTLR